MRTPLVRAAIAAFVPLAASSALAQQKRVYIAPDDHVDYFWTADDAQYRQSFLDTLDYYLDLADQTQANPSDFQSRWNCDGWLWLATYERHRSPAQFQRLIDRIADGHVSVPLNALAINPGGAPAEAVLRGMYYPGVIERRHGVHFPLVYTMEDQTQAFGIASLWRGSGARWSWKGICACDTSLPDPGNREHDAYRALGPDGTGVTMKWNSLLGSNEGMGGYAEARFPAQVVDFVTTNAPFNGFLARWPYVVIGAFGKGWDDFQTTTAEFVTVAQQSTNPTRRVRVSNELDFFADFEATYPPSSLPSIAASYGNEWDLACAGLAEPSARMKRGLERLRAAEALATVESLQDPAFMAGRDAARELAHEAFGLYWEHDFTMVSPPTGATGVVKRIQWQRDLAAHVEAYVEPLLADGRAALGRRIAGGGASVRFFAFNPLGFARTDAVDFAWSGPQPVHVVDVESGLAVPSQIVSIDGVTHLRALASDVPSVGYKVYEVRPGAGPAFAPAATVMPGSAGPLAATYTIGANERDALSNAIGGGQFEVRVSGYGPGDRRDYVSDDADQQTSALAFAVAVPPGSTIVDATLVVRASPFANPSATGAMQVRAYDVGDVPPFVDGASGDLELRHPLAPGSVAWPQAGWSPGADQSSPNLASLVQRFVDRADYAPGHHVGLVVTDGDIASGAYVGFEDFASGVAPARLVVGYVPPGGGGGGAGLIAESSRYRVQVEPNGAISRFVDRAQADRELVALVNGRRWNDLGPSAGTIAVESSGPVSVTLVATAPAPLQHVTRVTLYRDGPRVDVENRIAQNFGSAPTWDFGFALQQPFVRHEEVGAIARARRLDAGGDYATRQARYDWLTLNHFADVSGLDGAGVTLCNWDCYFFRLGNSTVGALDTTTPSLRVLAGGNVWGGSGQIANQGGDSAFLQRFALRARATWSPAEAMRTALAQQNPLVASAVTGTQPVFDAARASFASVSDPDVLLWALKPAEEGIADGVVARLWNLADAPRAAVVQLAPRAVCTAAAATHLETDVAPMSVGANGLAATFARQELRTFRLHPVPAVVATSYCVAAPNSVGSGGVIAHLGSTSIAANDLVLRTTALPPNANGLYFVGAARTQVPFGNGFRCVAAPILRLGIVSAAGTGTCARALDFASDGALAGIVPGDVRDFQLWYRDPQAGGALFNLSGGLELVLCP